MSDKPTRCQPICDIDVTKMKMRKCAIDCTFWNRNVSSMRQNEKVSTRVDIFEKWRNHNDRTTDENTTC